MTKYSWVMQLISHRQSSSLKASFEIKLGLLDFNTNVLVLHINFLSHFFQLGLYLYVIIYNQLVKKHGSFTNTESSMQGLAQQRSYIVNRRTQIRRGK
jgi:hypothetical protein